MSCNCKNNTDNTNSGTANINSNMKQKMSSNTNFRSFLELASNKITLFDNTIVPTVSSNSLVITNITESSLTNLPLLAPTSVYNAEFELYGLELQLNSGINKIKIPGSVQFLEEAIESANVDYLTSNSTTNDVITPFKSSNLYGQGIGVNQLIDNLAGYALFTANTLGSVKTYTLMLRGKSLS
jgi:hypothetical protein